MKCIECGKEFLSKTKKVCSIGCRNVRAIRRQRQVAAEVRALKPDVICGWCRKKVENPKPTQLYHKECRNAKVALDNKTKYHVDKPKKIKEEEKFYINYATETILPKIPKLEEA